MLRLMHVHAHPDDESSKGAASTVKYVKEGVDVHVVTCTGGERGSILNPKMERPDVLANISEIRRQEMDSAREILGVRQDWLGFVDSGWPEGDPKPPLPDGSFALVPLAEAAAPLVKAVREFRPHVILTYDENGGYPHPDHIKTHQVTVEAFEAAAAPITAFLIAPIAQFWIIPYMNSDAGQQTWGWLLGEGEARGIALVFLVSGLVMVVLALLAFSTRAYRQLSAAYETALSAAALPRSLSSGDFRASMTLLRVAATDASDARATATASAEQAEAVRAQWTAAAQRTKGLERLRDRHQEAVQHAEALAEERAVDDLVTGRAGRGTTEEVPWTE